MPAVAVVTPTAEAIVTGQATALLLLLARAHCGPDRLSKWTTVGDVVQHIGSETPGLFGRKALDALVGRLRRTFERNGIAPSLLQRYDMHGLRLAAWPVHVVRGLNR